MPWLSGRIFAILRGMRQYRAIGCLSRVNSPTGGFTLLEMAVVVVIIGLLTAGILSGKSFLANAELRSLMTESQVLINAFNQFSKTYGAYPGDYNPPAGPPDERPWPAANYGDGNGVIRSDTGGGFNERETFIAFEHLARAGLIKGNYTGDAGNVNMGTNVPVSSITGVGFLLTHPDDRRGVVGTGPALGFYFQGQYGHILWIGADNNSTVPSRGFLRPSRALAFDDKFDDGTPGTGWITTRKNVGGVSCATTADPTTAAYNVAQETNAQALCYFFLNIPGT